MEKKRQEIRSYFDSPKKLYWVGMGVLFAFIVYYAGVHYNFASWLFLIIYAVGGALTYQSYKKRRDISDSKIDDYVEEDLEKFKQRSLQKFSIDESDLVCDSVMVTWPATRSSVGPVVVPSTHGKDGMFRYASATVLMLHRTKNQIFTHEACLDLKTGALSNQIREEFFYDEIVSISCEDEYIPEELWLPATRKVKKEVTIRSNRVCPSSYGGGGSARVIREVAEKICPCELPQPKRNALIHINATSRGNSLKIPLRIPETAKRLGNVELPAEDEKHAIEVIRENFQKKIDHKRGEN